MLCNAERESLEDSDEKLTETDNIGVYEWRTRGNYWEKRGLNE